ncbi:MAG: DUF4231 domain-containing protein [bacterium]|nr:DUF4231 domain-containing protein [bacterium]
MSQEEAAEPVERTATLEDAWQRFAIYDQNSIALQGGFMRLHNRIIALAVLATALAIVYAELEDWTPFEPWRRLLWILVIATPIIGGVLAGGATKIDRSIHWVQLRSSAETVKREIYRYRARVGPYAAARTRRQGRDQKLAKKIEEVTRRLLDSDVAKASLKSYRGPLPPKYGAAEGDDGFSDLSAERYLELRLVDQLNYYSSKSGKLDRQLQRLQWTVAGLGASGAILAALSLEVWIPVSVSLAAALTSFLELRRVETTLASYAGATMELENVLTWWRGLPEKERASVKRCEQIVTRTESILQSENADWQAEIEEAMEEAMEELREDGEKKKS